ncbi:hypothetical protein Pan216_15870 [Planctomycetes bacterium Pan216]|uniref:Uncharacterized protein n=1 Tax=Kolteria novifilia TaxID=2527975 RepID=A0A518B1A0_9BACT|nr:hypothetical protein Pan216_15870 [Planctomycetes bacterium Pan216]
MVGSFNGVASGGGATVTTVGHELLLVKEFAPRRLRREKMTSHRLIGSIHRRVNSGAFWGFSCQLLKCPVTSCKISQTREPK